ncbi:hypothetical protein EDB85DRAFT_1899468 [Lactarius pseudohatsudake]|nr:hypothetical protein EDB85DRAFT_1899468 [Lactarius pseudohatsudake]
MTSEFLLTWHIEHLLEYFYWSHWSLFPVHFGQHKLSTEVYDELLGMLSHGGIDVMVSKTSTLWLNDNQIQKIIRLIQDAKVVGAGEVHYIAGAATLLSHFAHWRFINFHGQINARLDRHKAIYHEQVWESLITRMVDEWGDLILWSTVMFSVNVGLLAIPGVVPSNGNILGNITTSTILSATPSQIAIYLSLLTSVGGVVVSLLLIQHHHTQKEDTNFAPRANGCGLQSSLGTVDVDVWFLYFLRIITLGLISEIA